MKFPETRATLEAAGYSRSYYGKCRGCAMAIEWWSTPNGQRIPMDSMSQPDSAAVSHFATCPKASQFKKEPHRCTPIYPTSISQDSQPSLFSDSSFPVSDSSKTDSAPSPAAGSEKPADEPWND